MAHFRGTIQGNRGEGARISTKSVGLTAHIASWEGAVDVRLWYDDQTNRDMAEVFLGPHHGAGLKESKLLYLGPVSGKGRFRRRTHSRHATEEWQRIAMAKDGK